MISVKNNRDVVQSGDFTNVLGCSNAPSNGSLVVSVISSLSANELASSLREGHHDWTSVFGGSLDTGIDRVASYNINSWDGESCLFGVVEKINKGLSSDNSRLDRCWQLSESL